MSIYNFKIMMINNIVIINNKKNLNILMVNLMWNKLFESKGSEDFRLSVTVVNESFVKIIIIKEYDIPATRSLVIRFASLATLHENDLLFFVNTRTIINYRIWN